MKQRVIQLDRDEDGVAAVEYALMLALIVLAALGTISGLGEGLGRTFITLVDALGG